MARAELRFPGVVVKKSILRIFFAVKEEIGEDSPEATSPDAFEKTAQTINNYIGTNVFAADQSQIQFQQVNPGDWNQLVRLLKQSGLSDEDVDELAKAQKEDGGKIGDALGSWIKKMAPKALFGGVKLTLTAAQTILTEYLKQHYGLH